MSKLLQSIKDDIQKYYGIITTRQIADKLGISYNTVKYYLRSLPNLSSAQKLVVYKSNINLNNANYNYFNDVTLNSAYWAGFIAADGCVLKHNIKIKLKASDSHHLEKFKSDIEYIGSVKYGSDMRNGTLTYFSVISFNNYKLVNDLYKIYNITENKSLTLNPPNVTDQYADSYIKGYFDGDGTIYLKQNNPIVRFQGSSYVQRWIKQRIDNLYCKNTGSVFKTGSITRYELNTNATKFFMMYMSNIETPALDRKWSKFTFCSLQTPNNNMYI